MIMQVGCWVLFTYILYDNDDDDDNRNDDGDDNDDGQLHGWARGYWWVPFMMIMWMGSSMVGMVGTGQLIDEPRLSRAAAL